MAEQQHDQGIEVFDFPCVHRGEPTGYKLDCGCEEPEPVYECHSPKNEARTCVVRKKVPGRIVHGECNICPVREEPLA